MKVEVPSALTSKCRLTERTERQISLEKSPACALERSGAEGGGRVPYQAHVKQVRYLGAR